MSFSPRLSTAGQVNVVEVRGWDPSAKTKLLGSRGAFSCGDSHRSHRQDSSKFIGARVGDRSE